jgi:hypothetical protein
MYHKLQILPKFVFDVTQLIFCTVLEVFGRISIRSPCKTGVDTGTKRTRGRLVRQNLGCADPSVQNDVYISEDLLLTKGGQIHE